LDIIGTEYDPIVKNITATESTLHRDVISPGTTLPEQNGTESAVDRDISNRDPHNILRTGCTYPYVQYNG
jgi:hypothetical protein